jgi:hypothetical protein
VFDKYPELMKPSTPEEVNGEKHFDIEESLIDYSEFVNKVGSNG